jgi:isochorismate synthase
MDFKTLLKTVSQQYHDGLPFAIYAPIGSQTIRGYLQKDSQLHTSQSLTDNGFVLAPFDSRLPTLFIPETASNTFQTHFDPMEVDKHRVMVSETEQEKNAHVHLLQKTIDTIKKGDAKKIVISRNKDFSLKNFTLEKLIEQLFSAYPNAYRYVWFHPETGIWCGATPEVLVDVQKSKFETMALAGTQPYTEGEVSWRKKEKEEQYFVTEAILDNLKDYIDDLQVSEVQTIRAGALFHLKTDIYGVLKDESGVLSKIVDTMHPTPAVCGTPKLFSRDFIIENEHYSREFYTGYVGTVADDGTTAKLKVNLRCMKIKDDVAKIMVGGGITIDSDVEEEWGETQNKMQTMLQVLRPMF